VEDVVHSLVYSLLRLLFDVIETSRADRAEVLVLRRQVQVLEG